MFCKASINGGRTKSEHAAVPVTPQELAIDAQSCLRAGATAIHLHVRGTSLNNPLSWEKESLYPDDVARTLNQVRSFCSLSGIGVSTGLWILPDVAERYDAISRWDVLPGFASVNFIEEGAEELALLLLSRGVDVEAGLSEPAAAEVFVKTDLASRCMRVLFEPQEQTVDAAIACVNQMENILDGAHLKLPRFLHGTESTTWPMLDEALRRGYGWRVGFEDTLLMPDGTTAESNVELLNEASRRAERPPSDDAR